MATKTPTELLDTFYTDMRAALAAGAGVPVPPPVVAPPPAPVPPPAPGGVPVLFQDDFSGGIGKWADFYKSPGWVTAKDGGLAITTPPATRGAANGPNDTNYTHAAIAALKGVNFPPDCAYEVRAKLLKQTRTGGAGNQPNAWEVPWLMFRFTDERHYYYVHFKAHHLRDKGQDYGGFEIGKYNTTTGGLYGDQPGQDAPGQEVLWHISAADLKAKGVPFDFCALGQAYDWRVEVRDVPQKSAAMPAGVSIIVKLNGIEVANVLDVGKVVAPGHTKSTPPVFGGGMALYCEDADVRFDNVRVTALT